MMCLASCKSWHFHLHLNVYPLTLLAQQLMRAQKSLALFRFLQHGNPFLKILLHCKYFLTIMLSPSPRYQRRHLNAWFAWLLLGALCSQMTVHVRSIWPI
uniref:Uncharacterized protein n=1 Tax=Opuntia streptacantha TaxID=393608 RepID=A0A7C9E2C3_OPUST